LTKPKDLNTLLEIRKERRVMMERLWHGEIRLRLRLTLS